MEKKEPEPIEIDVTEAYKLINYLLSDRLLPTYNLKPRELDMIKMRWNYGLTMKQIAEKIGKSLARTRQLYNQPIYRIYNHIYDLLEKNPDTEVLKNENKRLQTENNLYKKKFAAMSAAKKKEFNELDIVVKNIDEVGFSTPTFYAMHFAKIKTVGDLLQFRLSSLLRMKQFDIRAIEEIEKFVLKHGLRMKK